MHIKEVIGKIILDSRRENTIEISIKTNVGDFYASAPNGKSTGKFEAKPYKKSIEGDIKALKEMSDYFSDEEFNNFEDLRKIEDVMKGHVGANTLFAFESAVLKAIAMEKKKDVWQIINPKAKKFPRLVGNCIGGGKHSSIDGKKPDFQEFLIIPETNSVSQAWDVSKNAKVDAQIILKNIDEKFKSEKNDEDAWITSIEDKIVLEVLKDLKDNAWDERKIYLDNGIDIASSTFCKRKKYYYLHPMLDRTNEEQIEYLSSLIKNFNLFYIEDPFYEDDFESFAKLLKKFPDRLIAGDDLTVTNAKRLEKAIKNKSINAIIVKPNQCGSLLEVAKVVGLARKNKIKIVFSHRSGETEETILADLAFGFGADFFKCGITGKEREAKLKRMREIEGGL
ncbi:MAG: hypothetical protein KKA64_04785 [Nanoarchaeota archaeon]|nr:hypothetical protein [Nanoarchaeota archaeon]